MLVKQLVTGEAQTLGGRFSLYEAQSPIGLGREAATGLLVAAYNLERMANHGTRRAAEMEEVADTLRQLGIEPHMATATVARQRQMGEAGKTEGVQAAIEQGGEAILPAVSAALGAKRPH